MLKLKPQYSDHLRWKADSLEKILMLGKIEGRRRRGRQRMRWLDGITQLNGHEFEQSPGDSEGQESLACCSPWTHKQSDTTEQQQQGKVTEWIYSTAAKRKQELKPNKSPASKNSEWNSVWQESNLGNVKWIPCEPLWINQGSRIRIAWLSQLLFLKLKGQ